MLVPAQLVRTPVRLMLHVGLVLALVPVTGCAFFQIDTQPRIRDVDPRISNLDLQGLDLALDLTVNNPLPVSIPTPTVRYNLLVEGEPLAAEQTAQAQTLKPSGTTVATLPLRLEYLDLIGAAGGLADVNEVDYAIEGFMDLPGVRGLDQSLSLPFRHTGSLPILKAPRFSIAELSPPSFTLSGIAMNLKARVANPNSFPIDVDNLGYALQAGNVRLGDLRVVNTEEIPAEGEEILSLAGTFSASQAFREMLSLEPGAGGLQIVPRGSIQTPYGPIDLQKLIQSWSPLPGMGRRSTQPPAPAQ